MSFVIFATLIAVAVYKLDRALSRRGYTLIGTEQLIDYSPEDQFTAADGFMIAAKVYDTADAITNLPKEVGSLEFIEWEWG
mmetsp:Transcript_24204/g.30005  ORF Transcript_24204/g.30005 Transcript_24204/m.30005 type:complete len:81 (-) Transcript_24204:334-576(-)|eukprot:CAMPEP_0170474956 /NCGR_PEP_ID=MMETSP0123-20130129/16693_1 /TAXON_ID=182087 /ORGANISM="Favella ehrenbergii, Strain Fehren 1" /LENGTH=80 /DNA_ID=CAMNT_0010745157 /DNA_START=72 /DNA_END=314 /DNA_ORIENTATION=+